ncbi:MAG: hypothetical protein OEN49_07025 [Gammaproteobacteria bacterium]|nr:hypothetical protein [Gammaproteobacteria bacterium]
MTTTAKIFFVTLLLAGMATPVFADGEGIDCHDPKYLNIKNAAKKNYADMLAHDKAGRTKEAFDAAREFNASCMSKNEQEIDRFSATRWAMLRKTSLKLGEQAESKGKFAEAHKYFSEYYYGIAADRVEMKMATAKPDDFQTVSKAVYRFRQTREHLNRLDMNELRKISVDDHDAIARRGYSPDQFGPMMTERDPRLKAIAGHLDKLQAIATKNGEKFLSDEDKIFNARKTSMTAKSDSLAELKKARDWLGLFGQEKRANDRAEKRGDTLLADDSRKSLELAISYYEFPNNRKEGNVQKVRDKARRLGDAHLKKGEKKIAADYYNLAGLGDKAAKLEESHEAEKEKAEVKRQDKFKKDQKSLEKELGL